MYLNIKKISRTKNMNCTNITSYYFVMCFSKRNSIFSVYLLKNKTTDVLKDLDDKK